MRFFKNNNFKYNLVYLLSNSIYLNKYSLRNLKDSKYQLFIIKMVYFTRAGMAVAGKKMKTCHSNIKLQTMFFYQSNFSRYCAEKFLNNRVGPSEVLYNAVNTDLFYRYKKKIHRQGTNYVTGKIKDFFFIV